MAKLTGEFAFTGSIGNLTVYKMQGVDEPIVRKKGGPTRKQVKNSPQFENIRRYNSEFGGASRAGSWTRSMLSILKSLADYNISGFINRQLLPALAADTQNERGRRALLLSHNPHILEGFNLNRRVIFDSIIRIPVTATLNRQSLAARLSIPALIPGINFEVPGRYPAFSLVAALGIIPDHFHQDAGGYRPPRSYNLSAFQPELFMTEWFACSAGMQAMSVEVKHPTIPPDNNFSLILSVGIRFGTLSADNSIEQVRRAGAAKILAMG